MSGVIIALIGFYVLFALAIMVGQRRMIYLPSRMSESVALRLATETRLQAWRNPAGKLIGWRIPASSAPTATVVIMHGNAGSAINRGYMAEPIHESGAIDVYVLEYPGYGSREGSPSAQSFLAAGEELFLTLPTNAPVYLVSESLGAGVAAHLAKKYPERIAGMVMFVPYDRFTSVAQHNMPFMPAGLLLRDRYAPAEWLKDFRKPILFIVAANDTIIPARLGKRLYEGYAGPKELLLVEQAGHNDVAAQSAEWWKKSLRFGRSSN